MLTWGISLLTLTARADTEHNLKGKEAYSIYTDTANAGLFDASLIATSL